MRIILFTLYVLLVLLTSCSDEERTFQSSTDLPPQIKTDKLTNIINQIAGNNTIEGKYIGIAGSPSGQSRRLEQLDSIATNVQLTSFTDHANPVVRYYSFRALVRRKSEDIFDILLNHITDTVEVNTLAGCIGLPSIVRSEMIKLVTTVYIERDGYRLSNRQKKVIDSLVNRYPCNDPDIILR